MPRGASLIVWLAVALPGAVRAADPPPTREYEADRALTPIDVDGRLDEAAWLAATAYPLDVELSPTEGAKPSERTEVRFLYDDDTLYIGITCYDSQPERIGRAMGRRDHIPSSDTVSVALDPAHDHRTGYYFLVNASGVMEDRLLHDDTGQTDEWDAVWEGAAATLPDGWSAEFAIPFRVLRFERSRAPLWGVYVQRKLSRTHAIVASTLIPLSAGAFVSRFDHLRLGPVVPRADIELAPFAAARVTRRPEVEGVARPRLTDPSLDLGLDLRARLTAGLTLSGTLNPDFGQVEADPVILNLTRFEAFFPEKRPFFIEGMDLFQPAGGSSGDVPQQIFYSRRVGLDAPIAGAVKVGGEAAAGLQVGVIEALVAGAGAPPWSGSGPDRRFQLHWRQPLHFGLNDELPALEPTPQNFFAAVVRQAVGRSSFVGATAALATPIGPGCTEADAAADTVPSACRLPGGNTLGLQWDLRTPDGDWGFVGQGAASQVVRGPPSQLLGDGTVLRRGDLGLGGYATAGKLGGEPWRFAVDYEYSTPLLDLNATGYQPDQNVQRVKPSLRYVLPNGFGPLKAFSAGISATASWSTDGQALRRRTGARLSVGATLPGYHDVGCDGGYERAAWDLREVYGYGIPYYRQPSYDLGCSYASDTHRPYSWTAGGRMTWIPAEAALPAAVGWRATAEGALRPFPWWETRLGADVSGDPIPGRFVAEDGDQLVFGNLAARALSLTLRQQLVATPRLSFIGYLQLFTANGRYSSYFAAPIAPRVYLTDLRPIAAPEPGYDFRSVSLRVNLVLRWEWRNGSALYVVYARAQEGSMDPSPSGELPRTFWATGLGAAPNTEIFLVKWSYWFAL